MATTAQLLNEAANLEAHAKDCLPAWAITGNAAKYSQYKDKARNYRRAAELKGYDRREFMKREGLK